jgi:hypothetical protein
MAFLASSMDKYYLGPSANNVFFFKWVAAGRYIYL